MAQKIAEAIADYEKALQQLTTEAGNEGMTAGTGMTCLLSRDTVYKAVSGDSQPTPDALVQLAALDTDLRAQAEHVVKNVDLSALRKTVQPKPEQWWWFLDQEVAEKDRKADFIWLIIAGVCWTVAASLALDIVRRFLSGGPDLAGFLATIVQLLLTAGPLTKQGRELAQWLVGLLRVPREWAEESLAMASILSLLIIGLFYCAGVPLLAQMYNNWGMGYLAADESARARRAFQRATSLNPDLGSPYYNLATLYEDITEYDQAIELYKKALEHDPSLDVAYNNLARLYLVQGQAERVIILLRNGLRVAQDDVTRYVMHKNLGWAYYQMEQYDLARDELETAVTIRPDRTPAYYYLALTYEALEEPEAAISAWENCLRYIDYDDPEESGWAPVARTHLQKLREETR
jgi:tetratricopeptide (TPR) repeat protein